MNHIEGNYSDIVEWLDTHPGDGVGFIGLHGHLYEGGERINLNFGLFSINALHREECPVCEGSQNAMFVCQFEDTVVFVDTDYATDYWKIEQEHKTHLIRF